MATRDRLHQFDSLVLQLRQKIASGSHDWQYAKSRDGSALVELVPLTPSESHVETPVSESPPVHISEEDPS